MSRGFNDLMVTHITQVS